VSHVSRSLVSATIQPSPDLSRACERLLDDLGQWVSTCVRRYGSAAATDVHDQATYTTSWEPWVHYAGTDRVRRFLGTLRERIATHFHHVGLWRHGYWRMRDVHHGTEHFELFLGALWRMDRRDGATVEHLVDAVEHVGNWSAAVPPWFDWDSGLFHARHCGADGVYGSDDDEINGPDHLRCINLCLLAHEMTGSSRYLDLAVLNGGRWAAAITCEARLPVGLSRSRPIYALSDLGAARSSAAGKYHQSRRRFAPSVSGVIRRLRKLFDRRRVITLDPQQSLSELDRAERFLASNGVLTFLQLWRSTAQPRFREAAERLIGHLVSALGDPDAGAVAQVVRVYRSFTGDDRYDGPVLAAVEACQPWSFKEISVDVASPWYNRQPAGVGKRKDMLTWFEEGRVRRHNPMLLSLAAEIRQDRDLATRAVDVARAYFTVATRAFPDGRDHGCSARSVSSIARGHGRDNDTGVVTGVLVPMLQMVTGHNRPQLRTGFPDRGLT
jgi:hypothetical protein